MPTILKDTQKLLVTSDTEYNIHSGYFIILPKDVTADVTLALKAFESQGFVDQPAITESKIVYLPSSSDFKLTFADGTVSIVRLETFGGS